MLKNIVWRPLMTRLAAKASSALSRSRTNVFSPRRIVKVLDMALVGMVLIGLRWFSVWNDGNCRKGKFGRSGLGENQSEEIFCFAGGMSRGMFICCIS